MKRWIFPVIALFLLLSGCSEKEARQQFFAMDTTMSVSAWGKDAQDAVTAAVIRVNGLDALLSRTRADSEIALLNREGECQVSADTWTALSEAVRWNNLSGGAFDMTVAPVVQAWGFGAGHYRVPTEDELRELLALVDSTAITLVGERAVVKKKGTMVDLGGIAKGYAAAQLQKIMEEHGVKSALLDLGGNITVIGSRPDGEGWRVAVRDPGNSAGQVGVLTLRDCSAVTSGSYQRNFELDGKVYHHIIDPFTGYPADCGLTSVTVVCEDPIAGDALSTALFVLGEEGALELWQELGFFEFILVTENGRLVVTEGLRNSFEVAESTDLTVEWVA